MTRGSVCVYVCVYVRMSEAALRRKREPTAITLRVRVVWDTPVVLTELYNIGVRISSVL